MPGVILFQDNDDTSGIYMYAHTCVYIVLVYIYIRICIYEVPPVTHSC
jgi:hypothetical protein